MEIKGGRYSVPQEVHQYIRDLEFQLTQMRSKERVAEKKPFQAQVKGPSSKA